MHKPTDPERFFFSPGIPAEVLDFSPFIRLVHDFPVNPEIRIFRKASIGDHALHYFARGTGTYELDGESEPIHPGAVFLVRPGQGYLFRLTPGVETRMLNIHFDVEDEPRFHSAYPCDDGAFADKRLLSGLWPKHQRLENPLRYEETFFALLAAAGQSGTVAALQRKGRFFELLAILLDNQPGICGSTPGAVRALNRALETMRADLKRHWDINALARAAGISRSLFCQVCTRTTGLPPARLLVKERLQAAQFALLYTDAPLKQIARQCGFSNTQHFTRVFKNALGLPPGAFRLQHSNLDE